MKNKFIYPVDSVKRANDFLKANNLEYRSGPTCKENGCGLVKIF